MKAKIKKQCLFKAKGFYIQDRYSSTEKTDDIGRWARIVYYNGFCIAWISGFIFENNKIQNRRASDGIG